MMKFMLVMMSCLLLLMNIEFFYVLFCIIMLTYTILISYTSNYLYYLNISKLAGVLMIIMSILLILTVMILIMKGNNLKNYINSMLLVFLILLFSVMFFQSWKMFEFYILFEFTLILMLIYIIEMGNNPERLQAGSYLLIYTIFGSLPLLLMMMNMMNISGTSSFLSVMFMELYNNKLFVFSIMAFMIKLPIFMAHMWLPKAHVEASTEGSMILAGIMLKYGSYGLMTMNLLIFNMDFNLKNIFSSLLIIGGLLASICCMMQSDFKSLIAYSSVSHMTIMCGSFMMGYKWSVDSLIITSFSHGFSSAGLFMLIGMIYTNSNSRSLLLTNTLSISNSMFKFFMFLFLSFNIAAPYSLNMVGELSIIGSILKWSFNFLVLIMLYILTSTFYNMNLYSLEMSGNLNLKIFSSSYLNTLKILAAYILITPLLLSMGYIMMFSI